MIHNKQRQVKHLYLRAGFGPTLKDWQKAEKQSPKSLINKLFSDSEENHPIEVLTDSPASMTDFMRMSKEEKKSSFEK